MRTRVIVVCAALLLLGTACGGDLDDEDVTVPADLLTAIDAFYASVEAGDVESRIALLHPDIIMMPNHWTPLAGKPDVSEMFRASSDAVFRVRDRDVLSIEVSGDLACTVNSYWYTYHARGDEPQWHKTKNVHIWRLTDDGWKLKVDIWNSDVPMSAFEDE